MPTISKLDFVAVPSQDAERSRTFYGETLGLRPDDNAQFEFWVGETCLGIWEPEKLGMPFARRRTATSRCTSTTSPPRAPSWRARASSSWARPSTPASATWRSSPTPTATT